uniref:Uncharacterized protein n=1 Tax=Romanomermis culicivorax TaxID=13658 RepID=A0A915HFT3_ROMCU
MIGAGSVVLITCFLIASCCFFCDGCLLSGSRRRKNFQINRNSTGYFLPHQPSQQQRHRQQAGAQTVDTISEFFNVSPEDPLSTLNDVPNYQHYYPVPIFSTDYKHYDAPPPYPSVVQENFISDIDGTISSDERIDDRIISSGNTGNELQRLQSTSPPIHDDDDLIVNYEHQNLMNARYSEIYASAKDRLNEPVPG